MFNPLNFISKFIKSGNQKELDRIGKIVNEINNLEAKYNLLNNEDFPKKTIELKNKNSQLEMSSITKESISVTKLAIFICFEIFSLKLKG